MAVVPACWVHLEPKGSRCLRSNPLVVSIVLVWVPFCEVDPDALVSPGHWIRSKKTFH